MPTLRRKVLMVEENGTDLADQTELDYNAELQFFDNTSATDFESDNTFDALREGSFKTDNVVIVKKNPGPTHFSSIKAAIDSITDSSASNPYVVLIGPGVYTEAPTTLKTAITVKPIGDSTVIVEPSDVNSNLFTVNSENCRLQGITIRNVTNAAAISVTSSPTPAIFDVITISNCKFCILVESNASVSQAVLRNVRLIAGATTTHLIKVTSLATLDAIIRMYSAILTDDNGTAFVAGILVTGAGARIDPNMLLLRSTVGVGTGIQVADGGHIELTSGAEIHGFNYNLYFPTGGTAPTAQIQGLTSHDSVSYDILISHTTANGIIHGVARRAYISNAAPTTLLLSYLDPANANYNNTGMLITRGLSPELTTIVTDGAVHTLTRFDAHTTIFTGTTAGTILKLPDATTFAKTGHLYDVWNFSTQDIALKDNSNTLLATIKPNGHTVIVLRDISTAAGLWGLTYTVDSGNVFGNILFYNEADAETSTNSTTTFLNKISLTTPSLALGDYIVQYQFNWRAANADRQIEFRVQRGGSDLDTGEPFSGSVADRPLISGFKRVQTISGVQTFTLDFRVGGSSTTVYMYNARLFVWRVA